MLRDSAAVRKALNVVAVQIIPWLSYSVPGVLNLGLMTIDTSIALACFLACVLLDPGRCTLAILMLLFSL